jgi:hypothetical protein
MIHPLVDLQQAPRPMRVVAPAGASFSLVQNRDNVAAEPS